MIRNKAHNLIGKIVTVSNPSMGTSWTGEAIAFTEVPTLLVELESGFRLMLPASWAVEATPVDQSTERES